MFCFFFFKQKTAYEMRISDWSSDVCSSDLTALAAGLIGKRCGAHDVHVIDVNESVLERWAQQGVTVASSPDATLAARRVWILSVKPLHLKEAVESCRSFLQDDTLVISNAAGMSDAIISNRLGSNEQIG